MLPKEIWNTILKKSLTDSLQQLNGGKKSVTIKKLQSAGIHTIEDLLWIIPLHWNPIPDIQSFENAKPDEFFQGEGTITTIQCYPSSQKYQRKTILNNLKILVQDIHGPMTLTLQWFNIYPSKKREIEQLKTIRFAGKVNMFHHQLQIISPTLRHDDSIHIQYPSLGGILSKNLKNLFKKIPDSLLESITDPLETTLLKNNNLLSLAHSFKTIHGLAPKHLLSHKNFLRAKRRLIYQEFYLEQIILDIKRNINKNRQAPILRISNQLQQKILNAFPYKLTQDQLNAIKNITEDLTSGSPMMRLLQGDVGTGKTTVAFIAALISGLNGHQAAIICPTEALALQHKKNAALIFQQFNLTCGLLIGSQNTKEKKETLQALSSGSLRIVIGTHTLLQNSVEFKNLSLAIIDEQHKFGVHQRIKLTHKGHGVHTLTMTATPIPRSLAIIKYGDLSLSTIKSYPHGKKVITKIITKECFAKFLSFLNTRIHMGEQAYIVAPAINENSGLVSVKKIYQRFTTFFPNFSIALLHSQLDPKQKQSILHAFSSGKIQILIATSIIEVGIHVPNTTIMAIANPERFGLSSLHQLRGRVGRGSRTGFCFLLNESPHHETIERLKIIEQTTDGFEIAEADLKIRGEGHIFNTNQSGQLTRKIADTIKDQDILLQVKNDFSTIKKNQIYSKDYEKIQRELKITSSI